MMCTIFSYYFTPNSKWQIVNICIFVCFLLLQYQITNDSKVKTPVGTVHEFFFFWAKVHDFLSPAIYLSLMFLLLCFFFFAEKFFYSALDSIFENWNKVLSLPFETSCSTSKWYITTVLAFCFWLFRIFIETKTHLYNNSQDQATLYNKSFMLKQNREDI